MQIDFLCNQLHFLDTLVDHLWNEWSKDYIQLTDFTTKQLLKDFYQNLDTQIPTCYVIFKEHTFLGTCLIDDEDMQVHPECKPWLASVYVIPECRNQKIATTLLNHVIPKYTTLYLWTFNKRLANYYAQFGFVEKEVIRKHGNHDNIIFMKFN